MKRVMRIQPSPSWRGEKIREQRAREARACQEVANTRTRRPGEPRHQASPEASGHREDWNAEENGATTDLSLVGKHTVHRLVLDKVWIRVQKGQTQQAVVSELMSPDNHGHGRQHWQREQREAHRRRERERGREGEKEIWMDSRET
jgi:hypothetical protein